MAQARVQGLSTEAVARVRAAAARIWGYAHNPSGLRTGRRELQAKLRGEGVVSWWSPRASEMGMKGYHDKEVDDKWVYRQWLIDMGDPKAPGEDDRFGFKDSWKEKLAIDEFNAREAAPSPLQHGYGAEHLEAALASAEQSTPFDDGSRALSSVREAAGEDAEGAGATVFTKAELQAIQELRAASATGSTPMDELVASLSMADILGLARAAGVEPDGNNYAAVVDAVADVLHDLTSDAAWWLGGTPGTMPRGHIAAAASSATPHFAEPQYDVVAGNLPAAAEFAGELAADADKLANCSPAVQAHVQSAGTALLAAVLRHGIEAAGGAAPTAGATLPELCKALSAAGGSTISSKQALDAAAEGGAPDGGKALDGVLASQVGDLPLPASSAQQWAAVARAAAGVQALAGALAQLESQAVQANAGSLRAQVMGLVPRLTQAMLDGVTEEGAPEPSLDSIPGLPEAVQDVLASLASVQSTLLAAAQGASLAPAAGQDPATRAARRVDALLSGLIRGTDVSSEQRHPALDELVSVEGVRAALEAQGAEDAAAAAGEGGVQAATEVDAASVLDSAGVPPAVLAHVGSEQDRVEYLEAATRAFYAALVGHASDAEMQRCAQTALLQAMAAGQADDAALAELADAIVNAASSAVDADIVGHVHVPGVVEHGLFADGAALAAVEDVVLGALGDIKESNLGAVSSAAELQQAAASGALPRGIQEQARAQTVVWLQQAAQAVRAGGPPARVGAARLRWFAQWLSTWLPTQAAGREDATKQALQLVLQRVNQIAADIQSRSKDDAEAGKPSADEQFTLLHSATLPAAAATARRAAMPSAADALDAYNVFVLSKGAAETAERA